MSSLRLFTSESVTEGHPDKVADQISDAILDALLTGDPMSRVAVETLVTGGLVHVAGEVTTNTYVDIKSTVRGVVRDIGYTSSAIGFDADSCGITVSIDEQSPDIWQGVAAATDAGGTELGAGDQGLMFGYACTDTPQLMPLPVSIAHRLTARLAQVRKEGVIAGLRPDGKAQVTIGYDGTAPVRVETVVVSTQHEEHVETPWLREQVEEAVIAPVLAEFEIDAAGHRSLINPTGRFEIGGPKADAGLTGRKIIVDTYGGHGAHGGGAFSGKDPSKVDRSAAYAARHVAKNLVAAGFAEQVLVQVAYAIGVAKPVSINVNTYGTGTLPDALIARIVEETFDLRPAAIIQRLDLRKPKYRATAAYGHFGRPEFTWEQLDYVDALKKKAEALAQLA